MNKKTQSIFSLVAGCFAALVALFYLIEAIIELTRIGNYGGDATLIVYAVLGILVSLCATAGMCFCGVKLILNFTKGVDEPKFIKLIAVVFFAYHAVVGLLFFFFFIEGIEYFGVDIWLNLIVAIIGLVIALIAVFAKFDDKVNPVFNIVVQVFGFVAAIIFLALGAEGLGLAALIFNMLAFGVAVTYFIFDMILASKGGATPAKVEEPKAEEEPAKEDSAE